MLTKLQFVGVYGEPKVSGIISPRYEGGSSIGRGVSPCSEYKKNMSPEGRQKRHVMKLSRYLCQPASHLPPSFLGLIYFIYSYPGLRRFVAQPPGY